MRPATPTRGPSTAPRCDEVVEVLSLTAALALAWKPPRRRAAATARRAARAVDGIEAGAAASASGATSPPISAPAPEATPEPARATATAATCRRPQPSRDGHAAAARVDAIVRRFRVALGAHGVAAGVMSPSVSFGGAVDLRLGKLDADGIGPSLGVSFLYVPNDFLRTADDARVRWTAVAVTGCPGWSAGRVASVEPCAQVIGGWLDATGLGRHESAVGRAIVVERRARCCASLPAWGGGSRWSSRLGSRCR